MADTRRDKRAPVSLKVRFKSATVDEFIEQYSNDISRGGIFIKSKSPMSVGTLLKFEFQLKDESRLIHGVGRVIWKREPNEASDVSPAGMGIKFIKMDPDSRAMVEQVISPRGGGEGEFDAGANQGEAVGDAGGGGGGAFFPSTSAPEDLPAPEDRTVIRHASEFLASALADADETAAAEAAAGAEAARKRTEEIARQRAAAARAERDAKESETARREDTAVPAAADETAAMEPAAATKPAAAKAEAKPPEPEPTPAKKPEPKVAEVKPAAKAVDDKGAPAKGTAPASDRPPPREQPSSRALPITLGIAAIAVVGFLIVHSMGGSSASTDQPSANPPDQGSVPSAGTGNAQPPDQQPTPPAAVDQAQHAATQPPPPAQMVKVHVDSVPPGATIQVDGQPAGAAPADVQVPVGRQVPVVVKAAGFAAQTQQVTATAVGQRTLHFRLQALPFVLAVQTTPPGAQVMAGGKRATAPGTIDLGTLSRPVRVVATMAGYTRATQTVRPDQFTEANGNMHYDLALTLTQHTTPTGGGHAGGAAGGGQTGGTAAGGAAGGSTGGAQASGSAGGSTNGSTAGAGGGGTGGAAASGGAAGNHAGGGAAAGGGATAGGHAGGGAAGGSTAGHTNNGTEGGGGAAGGGAAGGHAGGGAAGGGAVPDNPF